MEKIGQSSIIVLETINKCNSSKDLLKFTKQFTTFKQDTTTLASVLSSVGKSKNIELIVNSERMLIASDLRKLPMDEKHLGTRTSLETASRDLEKAFYLIAYVHDKEIYKGFESMVSLQSRDRINGLPRDAFHRFIDSNVTRLNNGIVSPKTSNEDKDILLERKSNMKIAKDEYMKLQAVTLDIKLPEKNKERDRER